MKFIEKDGTVLYLVHCDEVGAGLWSDAWGDLVYQNCPVRQWPVMQHPFWGVIPLEGRKVR